MAGYMFILPQYAGFLVFIVLPIVCVLWFSLHDWNLVYGTFEFIGLDNFGRILTDPEMPSVAVATVVYAAGVVPLEVGLGLVLALAMNQPIRGIGVFRTVIFAPVVVSVIAWTVVWRFILASDGILNVVLEVGGIHGPNWLREDFWALVWLVLVQVFKSVGLAMIVFLAALQSVPTDVREAAIVDGAGRWTMFRRITFPLITPFVFLMVVLATIDSLKSFGLVYWLTSGGPGDATKILSYYIYDQSFQRYDEGYGSALSVVLLLIVFVLTALQFAARRRWVYSED
jgi:multiple sugar transport system permease protein